MPNGSQYQSIERSYAGTWVDQVLQGLGAPTTDSNRAALRAWAASEGTITSNNPLAFSGVRTGATTCIAQCGTSSPIMAYNSSQQGAANTVDFILGNTGYAGIVTAFRQDAGLGAIYSAVNQSSWCKGCGTPGTACPPGTYPCALHGVVNISGGSPFPTSTSNPAGPAGVSLPVVGQILSPAEVDKFKGWFLMISGGIVAAFGVAVILASLGLETRAGRAVAEAVPGGVAVKALAGRGSSTQRSRSQATQRRAAQRTEERQRLIQERGSQQRATVAARQTRSEPGARPASPQERARSRQRLEGARRNLTPEQRRQVETF